MHNITSPGILPNDTLADAGVKALRYRYDWSGGRAAWAMTALGEVTPARIAKLRAASRRMRNDLRLFEHGFRGKVIRPISKHMRELNTALARARSCDARLTMLDVYIAQSEDARLGLRSLQDEWSAQRDVQRLKFIALVNDEAHNDWLDWFNGLDGLDGLDGLHERTDEFARDIPPGEPSHVRHMLPSVMAARLRDVRAFDTLPDAPTPAQAHALRLVMKRLRYTVEVLRDALPPDEATSLLHKCVAAQNQLGALSDAHDAAEHALQFAAHQGERGQTRPGSKAAAAFAAAQQKVIEARLPGWRESLQPFL